jgi:hypothetical protein
MKKFFYTLAAALLFACFAPRGGAAQDASPNRPVAGWSKAEVERFLNDSPWARSQTVKIHGERRRQAVAGAPMSEAGTVRAEVGSAEAPVDFTFTLRLRSARPVREALLRQRQLAAGYDRMNAKERAAFDADPKNRGLLECPACAENYVLTLSAKSKEAPGADPVFATFKGARLADLQRYVYLADETGARRQLVHFVAPRAPGEEAVFFFPRAGADGAPLFTPRSRELRFNVTENQVNNVVNFVVDVAPLVSGGALEF